MYKDLPRPTIFAHRGVSSHAPENTLAAFQLAVSLNVPAIELDAKLSADGEIVIIHDQSVDRTTNGYGLIRKLPLSALRELDAGTKFNPVYKGEKIPTLTEVFDTVGQKLFINIELTNYASPLDDLPIKVAELVKHHRLQDWVLFSSFYGFNLRRAHRVVPEVPLGLLLPPGIKGSLARSLFGRLSPYQALHPEFSDVSTSLIDKVHRQARRIHIYTVNDPQVMRRFFSWGVDGIFTDDPAVAMRVRNESNIPKL